MTTPPEKEFDRLRLFQELNKWQLVLLARELSKWLTDKELKRIIEIIKK